MKKSTIALLALVTSVFMLAAAISFPVFAASDTYYIPELDMTLDIPSEYHVITRDTEEGDPVFNSIGKSYSAAADYMKDGNIYLYATTDELSAEISIVSAGSAGMTSFAAFSDSMLASVLEATAEEMKGYGFDILDSKIHEHSQAKFMKLTLMWPADSSQVLTYLTYINSIDILITVTGMQIPPQLEAEMDAIVGSIRFGASPASSDTSDGEEPLDVTTPEYTIPDTILLPDSIDQDDIATHQFMNDLDSRSKAVTSTATTVIALVLWALLPGFIARHKGRSFWGYFLLSLVISPLVVTIIVLCLKRIEEFEPEESAWTCPLCGTDNDGIYNKCRNCGHQKNPSASAAEQAEPGRTSPVIPESGTWTCASCGTENKTDYTQCKKCGKFRGQS